MMALRAICFDLDGVVRHYTPCNQIEEEYDIPSGTLTAIAFRPAILSPAVCGICSHGEWIEAIGEALSAEFGEPSRGAAAAFAAVPSTVDGDVLSVVRRLRTEYIVAAITNGTSRLEADMAQLGLDSELDAIFNSAAIGFAKPDRRIYEHAAAELRVTPQECIFIDDSDRNLAGARESGMIALKYTSASDLIRELRTAGIGF